MKRTFTSRQSEALWLAGFTLLALLLFAWVLINRNPFLIRPASVAVRYGYTLAAPAILAALLLAYHPGRITGVGSALLGTVILFAMVLNGLWASGQTEPVVISGLLPWSDPSAYYLDALGWLQGFKLSEMSAIRPISTFFLALILSLSGKNLQISIAVLVALAAFSSFLFSQKVKEQNGFIAAALALLLVFLYYRRISGTTLSENLGLVLALLGYANLLIAAQTRKKGYLLLGVFLVALSLNTRPGPFFILIGLIVWSGLLYFDGTRKTRREFVWMLLLAALAVGLAFGVNSFIRTATASNTSLPFANFSYALYGLVSGGEGYTQIFVDHPELRDLPGNSRHYAIFQLAWESFLHNPRGLLQGAGRHLSDFLLPGTWYSMFGYVGNDSSPLAIGSRAVLEGLSALTVFAFFKRRHDPVLRLVMLVILTTLLSVPFVPPGDAHKLRLYCAAIPIIALLPALGFTTLLALIPRVKTSLLARLLKIEDDLKFPDPAVAVFSAALCALVIAAPFLSRTMSAPTAFVPTACPPGSEAVYFEYSPGSTVFIYPDEVFFLDWLPSIHRGRFEQFLHGLPDAQQMANFAEIDAPAALFSTVDLAAGRPRWVIVPPALLPRETGAVLAGCGQQAGYLFAVDQVRDAAGGGAAGAGK